MTRVPTRRIGSSLIASFVNPPTSRLALWWLAVNSAGVFVSIGIEEYSLFQWVRRGDLIAPRTRDHMGYLITWLAFMLLLGSLQVVAGCWLIVSIRIRTRFFRVVVGTGLGVLAALTVVILGVLCLQFVFPFPSFFGEFKYGAEPLIGVYAFVLSGALFGALWGQTIPSLTPRRSGDQRQSRLIAWQIWRDNS